MEKFNQLSLEEINNFEKWAIYKEKHGRCLLSPVLIYAYRLRYLRPLIRKMTLRLEGELFFTKTLREIFDRYYNVKIGRYSYGGVFVPGLLPSGTRIGNYCSTSITIDIHRRNHTLNRVSQHPFFYNGLCSTLKVDMIESNLDNPLIVGHDVWIGSRSIILPNCHRIGDGAIIGAGSIVTKDVEPFTIIAGNPGRVVRRRFSEEVEKKIIQSKWWFQPLSVIAKELPCFINNPTTDLLDRFNFS